MVAIAVIAPTKALGSGMVSVETTPVTIGVYTDGGGPIEERGGVNVYMQDPLGGLQEARDKKGRPIVLTQAEPIYKLDEPGAYLIYKSPSNTTFGVFSNGAE